MKKTKTKAVKAVKIDNTGLDVKEAVLLLQNHLIEVIGHIVQTPETDAIVNSIKSEAEKLEKLK